MKSREDERTAGGGERLGGGQGEAGGGGEAEGGGGGRGRRGEAEACMISLLILMNT